MAESSLIRRADVGDAQRLSGLIERVARHCCFAPAQAMPAWFLATIAPDALAEAIARPDFAYFVGQLAGDITVRSSLVAVPVYERFGFTIAGPAAEKDGFGYQPMALRLD